MKGTKRARVEVPENDVRRFLSLEATELDSDDNDDEDEEEMDDFWDGDEPIPADREVSHRLLFQQHTRVHVDGEWEALLHRARERALCNEAQGSVDVNEDLTIDGPPTLWRVAVKPGCEETVAFALMEKIIRAERWSIKAIIGRVSCPGWVVIEAAAASDVEVLCHAVSNVFSRQIHVVLPDDAPSCLRERRPFLPRPCSWVRLTTRPYHGDLAYVKGVNDDQALEVLVVPRINFQRRKRKRGGRPEQALFDENRVRDVWGQQSVSQRNQVLVFKCGVYHNGFLALSTHDFQPEEAVPSSDELAFFLKSRIIPPAAFLKSVEIIGARRLQVGNSVKVIPGQSQGAVGVVEHLTNDDAVVSLGTVFETLPVSLLRKHIRIGDEVQVVIGPNAGFEGWVVSLVEDSVLVYDHKASKEVVVRSDCVHFRESPFIMVDNRPQIGSEVVVTKGKHAGAQGCVISCTNDNVLLHDGKGQKALEVPLDCVQTSAVARAQAEIRFYKDHNHDLIGKHVRVIKKNMFKDYEAIIKSTQEHNYVWIEIQATMRQERIHLSNLCLLNDLQMQPLNLSRVATARPSFASQLPTTRAVLPPSSLPLVASTPLPAGTSVTFSPAWDPSSRTPNPGVAFPYNPWMTSEHLVGKPIRVRFKGTTPVLQDPGWKHGDYESKWGIWNGTEGLMAKVLVAGIKTLVPEKYVRPVPPELKSQVVVSLDGFGRGQEYIVSEFIKDECIMGIRNSQGRIPPKTKVSHLTRTLAVLGKK